MGVCSWISWKKEKEKGEGRKEKSFDLLKNVGYTRARVGGEKTELSIDKGIFPKVGDIRLERDDFPLFFHDHRTRSIVSSLCIDDRAERSRFFLSTKLNSPG